MYVWKSTYFYRSPVLINAKDYPQQDIAPHKNLNITIRILCKAIIFDMGYSPCVYEFCQSGKKFFAVLFIRSTQTLLYCCFAAQTVLDDASKASIMLLKLSISTTSSVLFENYLLCLKVVFKPQTVFLHEAEEKQSTYKRATLTTILFIRILSLQPLGEHSNYIVLYYLHNIVYAFCIIDVLLLLLWKLLLLQNVFIFCDGYYAVQP